MRRREARTAWKDSGECKDTSAEEVPLGKSRCVDVVHNDELEVDGDQLYLESAAERIDRGKNGTNADSVVEEVICP